MEAHTIQAIESPKNKAMAKAIREISLRSHTTTAIKKATTPGIVPSQKICYSVDNIYIGDC